MFLFYYITLSLRKQNKLYEFIAKKFPSFVNNIHEIFQKNINQRQVYLTIIYSTLIEFCGIFHVYIAIYALGLPPSFTTAALGYTLSVLLMIISPFLRGLGAVEFTMIYVFTQLGYSHSQGLAATLLYRIFEFWLPLLLACCTIDADWLLGVTIITRFTSFGTSLRLAKTVSPSISVNDGFTA